MSKTVKIVLIVTVFIALTVLTVYLFPRYNNAFNYHFEIGKPWGYELVTAEFDFPIYKTDEQMAKEQQQLLSTFTPCYKYLRGAQRDVNVISLQEMEWLQSEGFGRIAVKKNNLSKTYPLSEVYTPKSAFAHYGYECAQNLVRDTLLTDQMRDKLLSSLSPTQGMVQKGEKIIDHGEIVTERNYQILQSLRRAYDDESLGNKQRKLSILGEAILVVLFLCLFVHRHVSALPSPTAYLVNTSIYAWKSRPADPL